MLPAFPLRRARARFLVALLAALGAASVATPAASAPDRVDALDEALASAGLAADKRAALRSDFARLPLGAQDAVLGATSPRYALATGKLAPAALKLRVDRPLVALALPSIDVMLPAKGASGEWVVLAGDHFKSTSVVLFDGAAVPTSYFFGMLVFQVPAGKALAHDYPVRVRNGAFAGLPKTYRVAAPLGYRGLHGWKFANFSTPTISWGIYRDYFGAGAVELANGQHRPLAQDYYDAYYKRAGDGGDCFGMSLRSVRTRRQAWQGLYQTWWPQHAAATVWDYDWVDPQIGDSVREDQGAWFSNQALTVAGDRSDNQRMPQLYQFVRDALASGDIARTPVLAMWRYNAAGDVVGGHAVIPYKIETTAQNGVYTFRIYDNNKPYSETEANDNGSAATVDTVNDTFSYGNYTWAYAGSFNEYAPAAPVLPSDAQIEAWTSEISVVVAENPSAIKQIRDAAGRRLLTPGGQVNKDAATRIPGAFRHYPLTGGAIPADFPAVYVLRGTRGKAYSVEVDQASAAPVRVFSPGRAVTIVARRGTFQLTRLMEDEGIFLIDPSRADVQRLELLAAQRDGGERRFTVTGAFNGAGNFAARITRAAPTVTAEGEWHVDLDNGLAQPFAARVQTTLFGQTGLQQRTDALSLPARSSTALFHPSRDFQTAPPRTTVAPMRLPLNRVIP